MMKRIPFVFAAALLMAALLYQPIAAAQGGIDNVDASIDAILNSPAPAVEPASAPSPAIAAAVEPAAETQVVEEVVEEVTEEVVAEAPVAVVVEAPASTEPPPAEPEASPEVSAAAPPTATVAVESEPASAINENGEVLVSMEFDEAPLPDVIRAFREASGANIISGWTNPTPRLVNMSLNNVEWRAGLNALVASYGLELKEEPRDSGIYVVREKVHVEAEQPRYVETFELQHSNAEEISQILQHSFGFSAPVFESTNKNAKANSAILGDGKSMTIPYLSGNIVVVKGTEQQLKDCRSIINVLDVPKRQVYIEARFVRLNSSASKKLGTSWDMLSNWGVSLENVGGSFNYKDGSQRTSGETTAFSASGRAADLNRRKLDATRDFTSTRSHNDNSDHTATFTGLLSVDNARLAFSAFEEMNGVQVFSNPKIIVENGKKAFVDMTTREPNVLVKIEDSSSEQGGSKISSQLEKIPGENDPWVGEAFFKYGIELEVIPRVSPSGLITVEVIPSISQKDLTVTDTKESNDGKIINTVDGYRIVGPNRYPIIRMQRLITTFTMANGKTAVIGGLTETSENTIDSGIPLLRSIPWIGPRIFGWKSREKNQYEILVFVTVGLADSGTIGKDVDSEQGEGIGMPKNAVLGRGLLDGTLKEPGDREDWEMFDLESKPKGFRIK